MTDFAGFKYGGVEFPLDDTSANTALRDADPALYYALEFFASVITTHIEARLLVEAGKVGASQIEEAVATALPWNPEPWLTEQHLRFPLLAVYRKGGESKFLGTRRELLQRLEVAYVLPPLKPAEAEHMLPFLRAVGLLLDNRTTQGFDPAYTPTAPTGTAGEFVWGATRAGIRKATITGHTLGAYQPTQDLYFPAIILALELIEQSNPLIGDYDDFDGADLTGTEGAIDLRDPDGTTVENFVEVETHVAPTVTTISPTSGDAAGGEAVTITGTGFRVGTRPRVLFGGAQADNVVVTSATQITCVTPEFAAYPTALVDLTVVAADGQVGELADAFTFNA